MGGAMPVMPAPLIVTARFDAASAAVLQRLRDQHFPADRNIVPAHCTLFHHLPGEAIRSVLDRLREVCDRQAPIPLILGEPRFLGHGVALGIEAAALIAVHGSLADRFQAWLTPQDRARFRPHVTIQNKVAPDAARTLLAQLQASPVGLSGTVEGLDLWHYRNGPWEAAASVGFAG